eukprot:symbB.v1.2.032435.t1/scaffold3895.1/size70954/2
MPLICGSFCGFAWNHYVMVATGRSSHRVFFWAVEDLSWKSLTIDCCFALNWRSFGSERQEYNGDAIGKYSARVWVVGGLRGPFPKARTSMEVSRSPPLFGVLFLHGRLVGVAAGVTAGLVCLKTLKAWIGGQRDKKLPPLVSLSRQDVAKFWLEGLFWKACLLAAKEAEEVWGTRVFRMRGAGLFETEKVYCVDPGYTGKILGANGHDKSDESYDALKESLGQGHNCLITRKIHENYTEIRKPIMNFFSYSNMMKRLSFCKHKLQDLVKTCQAAAEEQTPLELSELFCNVAVDILGLAAFSYDFEALQGGSNIGLKVAHSFPFLIEECGMKQRFLPFRKYMTFLPDVRKSKQVKAENLSFCKDLLRRRREETAKTLDPKEGHLLIDSLLKAPYESEDARAADVSIFLAAGHETVGYQISWCVHCLLQNPGCLKKAQEEVDLVMSSSKIPEVTALRDFKYVSACFRESMRLWPAAPEGSGRTCHEDIKIGKYHIPKGTQITMSNMAILRSKDWGDDAESFRPERWFDNGNEAIDLRKKAFLIFSYGPHQCPGMNFAHVEGPMVLATLLRNFRLEVARPLPEGEEMVYHHTARPRGGLWVRLHLR